MLRGAILSTLAVAIFVSACAPPEATGGKRRRPGSGDDDDDSTDPTEQTGGGGPILGTDTPVPSTVPRTGSLKMTVTADKGAASNAVVSLGVPFPQGVFKDAKNITVKDPSGKAVPAYTETLVTWPGDGSIRSVLVAFKATVGQGQSQEWTIDYGAAGTGGAAGKLSANPDGPAVARLTAEHYAASHVSGIILPAAKNTQFTAYETRMKQAFDGMSPGYTTFTALCGNGNQDRTYYDGPHSLYQWALRDDDAAKFRLAHDTANWYRANELKWIDGTPRMAINKCWDNTAAGYPGGPWTPDALLDQGILRRMLGQGMLDDYLLTGDPKAKEALTALGEAYIASLPTIAPEGEARPYIERTERNLGWTLMGVVSYYALDHREDVKAAVDALVARTYAWQARSSNGGFEHDIAASDPDECAEGQGPKGGSPFMTSLIVDGMMDWWLLSGDPKMKPFMEKIGGYFESALTSDKLAFRYLTGCNEAAKGNYEEGDPDGLTTKGLSLLTVQAFGAAYAVTKDKKWTTLGDAMVLPAVEDVYIGAPKQFNQSVRGMGRYLGYRAMQ